MRSSNRNGILLAAVLLAVWTAGAGAQRFQARPDWMVGVAWGFGRGVFEDPAGERSAYRSGSAPQIHFGRALGAHAMVSADYEAWMIEFGDVPLKHRRGLQNLLFGVSVFPGDPDGVTGGIYLRGAAGVGWTGTAEVPVVEGEEQGHGERVDEWGWGASVGAGYEFWVAPNFTTGVGASFDYLDIGETTVERAGFASVVLDLNLYF